MADYTKGYGASFGYADVGGSTFTKLARVLEIKPPKSSVDSIDTSHLESPDQWKEKDASWKEAGDAEVKVQFQKAQTATVYGLLAEDKSFQIKLADNSTLDFDGFVSGIEPEIDKDGLVTATLTFIEAQPHENSDVMFLVQVEYSTTSFGLPANPLNYPPEISYGNTEASGPYFQDYSTPEKKRCMNTAGDPFETFLEREDGELTITITVNEPTFSPVVMDAFKHTTNENAMSVTFTPRGAERIKRAVTKVLTEDRGGDRTGSTSTDATFWALVTGLSPDGQRYTFVRVYVTAENDSAADFKLANGSAYTILGEEPEQGLARESNGARGVPTYPVVRMDFCEYAADDSANFIFQWIGPTDTVYLPPHDHRDNYNGGFSFSVYHPGTGLPQQPWSQ